MALLSTSHCAHLKNYGLIWFCGDIAIFVSTVPALINPLPALHNSRQVLACTIMLVVYTQALMWFITDHWERTQDMWMARNEGVNEGNMLPNSSSFQTSDSR